MLGSLALAALVGLAHAQSADGSVDVNLYRAYPDAYGYLGLPGAATLGNLQLGVGYWMNYANDPVVLTLDGERVSPIPGGAEGDSGDGLVDDRVVGQFQLGMGFTRFFSIAFDLPMAMWQDGYAPASLQDPTGAREAFASSGLGDLRVQPKFVVMDREHGPFGLAVAVPVGVPTGDGASLMGEGAFTTAPQVVAEFSNGSIVQRDYTFRTAIMGGYLVRPEDRVRDVHFGNEILYGLAAGWHVADPVEFTGEFHGSVVGPRGSQLPAEVLLGTKLLLGKVVNINLGGGTGVLPGVGSPDYRVVFGVSLAPSFDPNARDSDKDGVVDGSDRCPHESEDLDGYQDEDGCPDLDNDVDNIPDTQDQCPDDPEDDDGYMDVDGCPDTDNDKDGIPDVSDRCPNDAETVNDYQDEDGCPDEAPIDDTDGDGYKDDVDRCPYDAEDFDNFQDEDGCPETDNDNDGIPDTLDQCPMVREIFNGVDDEDGCPDEGRVVVEKQAIKIKDRIYFDTGKATIQQRSYSLLDEIASVIQAHPELKLIRVEGHTDSVGNELTNLKLSQRRAEAVKQALIQRGVDPSRLDAAGFGEQRPIASNDTEEGRARNRRVEFIIVERE